MTDVYGTLDNSLGGTNVMTEGSAGILGDTIADNGAWRMTYMARMGFMAMPRWWLCSLDPHGRWIPRHVYFDKSDAEKAARNVGLDIPETMKND